MENSNSTFYKRANLFTVKLTHYVLSILFFACAWFFFRYDGFPNIHHIGFRYNYYVIIGYAVLLLFFQRAYNAYLLGYSRIRTLVLSQSLSQIFSAGVIYLAVSIAWGRFDNPIAFIALIPIQILMDIVWSSIADHFYIRNYPPKKTILIYRNNLDLKRFATLDRKSKKLYRVTSKLQFDGDYRELEEKLKDFDAIFVAGVNSRCRNGILKYCKETGTPGLFMPHVGDVIMQAAEHIQTFNSPVMYVDRKILSPEYALAKRSFDILMSALGLVVLSPILICTAVVIKLYDGGPALYKQVRLTKDGKEFEICKFRSMSVDAEKDGIARLSTGEGDDRITPVGRFIRKCRIDELPQLWNILKGEMSIVGPRPERPEIAEQYYKIMPDFQLRLQVKAGLTGYAQVYGKYNTDPYEKLEFDLVYINNMSIITDLQLMFATFVVLFSAESTEGIEEGSTTAMEAKTDE